MTRQRGAATYHSHRATSPTRELSPSVARINPMRMVGRALALAGKAILGTLILYGLLFLAAF